MREMKDSGIAWFGAIPKNWHVSKLKYVNHFFNGDRGKNYPSGNDLVDEGIIFLTSNNLHNDILDTSYENSKYITDERYKILGGAKLQIDDIVFCLRGSVGNCSINKTETCGTVASSLMTIRPHNINPDFLNYMLHSDVANSQTRLFVNGSCAENLSADNVANYLFVEPPLLEQQQIATYLNSKCSNINAIIFDIQRQIEVLQEYKQSVITEAVTKGLDKNVAMKDSGIEWIGSIPSTWNIHRLKYIVKSPLQYGANESGLDYDDELPRYVRITDIDNNGNLKDTDKQSLNMNIAKPYLLEDNDILLARSGATVGKAFLYHKNDGPCAFAGYLIRAKCKTKLLSKLAYYYTMSNCYNAWKNSIFSQATIPNIGADKYSNLIIPISTNTAEQKTIIDYLDAKCADIDTILADKQKQLDTLTEYKKSLIYEYVTGKKDVPADA